MGKTEEKHAPIQQSVHVDCPIEEAFQLFTEGFGEWWPHPSEDGQSSRGMEPWRGGRVFERAPSGEEREWGEVTAWEPPGRLEFTWHPGARRDERQTVSVEFRTEAVGTRVTLTHHGWHVTGVVTCLSRFAAFAEAQVLVLA